MTTLKKLTPRLSKRFEDFLPLGIAFFLFFIPLFPKLPVLDIKHTWVYIRLEDFLVVLLVGVWLFLLARKKINAKSPLTMPILVYWGVGLLVVLHAILFLSGQLQHLFPKLIVLHYLRRIEYLVLFFIALATVKNIKIVKKYLIIVGVTLFLVCLYGFGQKWLSLPAFLTTNEEFAKGAPLFLGPNSRISSLFAGPYDLAAYLVLMIGLFGSLFWGIKKWLVRGAIGLLMAMSLVLMLLTASRISLVVALVAVGVTLWLHQKKWLIAIALVAGLILTSQLPRFSDRFAKTFRVQDVVYSQATGKPIATLEDFLEPKESIDPNDTLPLGSGFLSLGKLSQPEAKVQLLRLSEPLTADQEKGSDASKTNPDDYYLVKKALVYDISFTTRYQGQWPLAVEAFKRNYLLGSGFSSLFLATDNDYLRSLGETGLLGFISFFGILLSFLLLARVSLKKLTDPLSRSLVIGMVAGLTGLLLNAILIDVFEASKVAFTFWMLMGITVGVILLRVKDFSLKEALIKLVKHPLTTVILLIAVGLVLFWPGLRHYFTGDDFTWLKWAMTTKPDQVLSYFTSAPGFFYRPLAKVYYYSVQPLFGLNPNGYHLISLLTHLGCTIGVYFLAFKLAGKRWLASLTAFLFLIHPVNAESIHWVSTTSHLFASFFYLWGFLAYVAWRQSKHQSRWVWLIISFLAFVFGLVSHERMVTFPLIIIAYDWLMFKSFETKKVVKKLLIYLPFWGLLGVYLLVRNQVSGAHGFSGDYSYSLKNAAFNFAGNSIGYLGELLVGFRAIPVYDWSRTYLRDQKLVALILGAVVLGLLILAGKTLLPKIRVKKDALKLVLFAVAWFVILLLPFIGLGNIAERYVYPAHFGYFLILGLLIGRLYWWFKRKNLSLAVGIVGLALVLLTGFYLWEYRQAMNSWYQAGEMVHQVVFTVVASQPELIADSYWYFVDLPIRYQRAWVFPVGLADALWLAYQDQGLEITQTTDLSLATKRAAGQAHSRVFFFQDGQLQLLP